MAKFSTFIIQLRSSQDSLLLAYIRIVFDKYVSRAERFGSEVKKFFNRQVRTVDRSNAWRKPPSRRRKEERATGIPFPDSCECKCFTESELTISAGCSRDCVATHSYTRVCVHTSVSTITVFASNMLVYTR